jgi:hypothetical protein
VTRRIPDWLPTVMLVASLALGAFTLGDVVAR